MLWLIRVWNWAHAHCSRSHRWSEYSPSPCHLIEMSLHTARIEPQTETSDKAKNSIQPDSSLFSI